MDNLVNIKHLQEYENIFRAQKMKWLWQEYLSNAETAWASLDTMDLEHLRLTFHSWKSSSQIFGMDCFVKQCAALEEKLTKHPEKNSLDKLIFQSRDCFQKSVLLIEKYFNQNKES